MEDITAKYIIIYLAIKRLIVSSVFLLFFHLIWKSISRYIKNVLFMNTISKKKNNQHEGFSANDLY